MRCTSPLPRSRRPFRTPSAAKRYYHHRRHHHHHYHHDDDDLTTAFMHLCCCVEPRVCIPPSSRFRLMCPEMVP